ncbi:MAG: 50S ribosomal protein L29 [Puniceicoccales bacterium]|jgi:ribosomal protein L29|nr:50S ribosomal protein L29 [Puniceicoccales bacterium]
MKTKKSERSEFEHLTDVELRQRELELRNELMLLRLKRKIGQLEKTHRFLQIRREIARILTIKTNKGVI